MSTSSSSQASGDSGSVKPRLRSTTTTAGRCPNPAALPNVSAIAHPRECGRAALERRPAQRERLDRGGQTRLLEAALEDLVQRRAVVEGRGVAALGALAGAPALPGFGVAGHHALRPQPPLRRHEPQRGGPPPRPHPAGGAGPSAPPPPR